jgi:type II secretory pathway pseudopilin PulG
MDQNEIEVLIVVLVIGILAAIAIPAFLGQKEKAKVRVMETTSKTVERELRMIMNHYSRMSPIVFSTSPGQQDCFQHIDAKDKLTCGRVYPDAPLAGTYQDVKDIIGLYVLQVNDGLNARSPYDGQAFLTEDASPASRDGHILLTNTAGNAIDLSAWNESGTAIYDAKVGIY